MNIEKKQLNTTDSGNVLRGELPAGRHYLRSRTAILLTGLLSAWSMSVWAVPVEVEGPITGIDAGAGTITVMEGIVISVPPGTPISSPTASGLALSDLSDGPALPGRSVDGFLAGTAIITGESTSGAIVADDVFVEPAENVVLGELSSDTPLRVNGLEVRPLGQQAGDPDFDARLPGQGVTNSGFAVDITTIPIGTLIATEGYFDSGALYAFIIESEGGTLVNAGLPEVSITRAQCRSRAGAKDEFDVLGNTHDPSTGRVRFQISDDGVTFFGNTTAVGTFFGTSGNITNGVAVAEDPVTGFGAYNFRRRSFNLPLRNGARLCPGFVKTLLFANATATTPLAEIVAPVDVRNDE